MQMNYISMHSWDHADSEWGYIRGVKHGVTYMGLNCKGAEFIGNKQSHSQTYIQTFNFILLQK